MADKTEERFDDNGGFRWIRNPWHMPPTENNAEATVTVESDGFVTPWNGEDDD